MAKRLCAPSEDGAQNVGLTVRGIDHSNQLWVVSSTADRCAQKGGSEGYRGESRAEYAFMNEAAPDWIEELHKMSQWDLNTKKNHCN